MNYYFSKQLPGITYEEAIEKTKQALKNEGFGVVSEIDFQNTFKEKLGVNFRKYLILQVCSPIDAYGALQADEKIGLMLPCNFVLQEKEGGIEVSSVDPNVMMQDPENNELQEIGTSVSQRLKNVINNL